jgi:hypothetical protein
MEIEQARQLTAISLICINNAVTAVRSSIQLQGVKKTCHRSEMVHVI